jgi:hypothetical protein
MSHPEPWPRQRDLEDVLRRELRMVAESVEPGADGLDRIRSRIRVQRPAPSGWIMAGPAGSAVPGRFSIRDLLPVHRGAQAFLYTGVHRFGPSDHRMGWHRWLRPMAAVATGVFVVLAGSWAVTALPQIIAASSSSSPPGAGRVLVGSSSGSTAPRTGSQHPVTGPGHSNPAAYPQWRHGSSARTGSPPATSHAPPASNLPSASPAPPASSAPTASQSATNSPSASPTPAKSCSPSPSPSPPANGPRAKKPPCHKPRHRNPRSRSSRSNQATIGNRSVRPCLTDGLSISACLAIG